MNHARVRKGKGFNDTLCVPCEAENNTFGSPGGCDKDIFEITFVQGENVICCANHDILIELFTRTIPSNGTSDLLIEVNGKT